MATSPSYDELVTSDQASQAVRVHSDQAGTFAERYDSFDPYKSCFAYSRMRLDSLLDRYLVEQEPPVRLLDVGCGTGHQLAKWSSRGYDVAGVDGSSEMLKHARRHNPHAELLEAPADRLPFPDGAFDRVTCLEVLRYLPDPGPCIEEMARVTRPGGACLATAAPLLALNGYALVNRVAANLPVPGLTRLRQFFTTASRLRASFFAAGFTAVTVHGVYLGPLIWVERLLPRLLPGALRAWEPFDRRLADRPILRDLGNMYLVHAVRGD